MQHHGRPRRQQSSENCQVSFDARCLTRDKTLIQAELRNDALISYGILPILLLSTSEEYF